MALPTLPNYTSRFNPRTGETSYYDPATGQWVSGLPTGQNANPYAGMDTAIKSTLPPVMSAAQQQAAFGGGGNPSGAMNTALNPGGGSSQATPTISGMNTSTEAPLEESEWSRNWSAMTNLLRTTPTLVGGGMGSAPRLAPVLTGMTGGGGAVAGGAVRPTVGGAGRAYVNSWGAPRQNEVRPWNPLPTYRR